MNLRHLYDEWNASRDYEAAHPLTAFSAGFNLAQSMVVKPLVWEYNGTYFHWASVPFGSYYIEEQDDGSVQWYYRIGEYDDDRSESDSVDEAKRAVQKHWEEWLAPALL